MPSATTNVSRNRGGDEKLSIRNPRDSPLRFTALFAYSCLVSVIDR
jgi:hypothetical protein